MTNEKTKQGLQIIRDNTVGDLETFARLMWPVPVDTLARKGLVLSAGGFISQLSKKGYVVKDMHGNYVLTKSGQALLAEDS